VPSEQQSRLRRLSRRTCARTSAQRLPVPQQNSNHSSVTGGGTKRSDHRHRLRVRHGLAENYRRESNQQHREKQEVQQRRATVSVGERARMPKQTSRGRSGRRASPRRAPTARSRAPSCAAYQRARDRQPRAMCFVWSRHKEIDASLHAAPRIARASGSRPKRAATGGRPRSTREDEGHKRS
jgi:hypothetical protein